MPLKASAMWTKAQRSGGGGSNCVLVRYNGNLVQVRDSKNPDGPVLEFTTPEWRAFIGGAQDGEFDL